MKKITAILHTNLPQGVIETMLNALVASGADFTIESIASEEIVPIPPIDPPIDPPVQWIPPGLVISNIDGSAGTALASAAGSLDGAPNDLVIAVTNTTNGYPPVNFEILSGAMGQFSGLSNGCDFEAHLTYAPAGGAAGEVVNGPSVNFRME